MHATSASSIHPDERESLIQHVSFTSGIPEAPNRGGHGSHGTIRANWREDLRTGLTNLLLVVLLFLMYPLIGSYKEREDDENDKTTAILRRFYGPFLFPTTQYFLVGLAIFTIIFAVASRRAHFDKLGPNLQNAILTMAFPHMCINFANDGLAGGLKDIPITAQMSICCCFLPEKCGSAIKSLEGEEAVSSRAPCIIRLSIARVVLMFLGLDHWRRCEKYGSA
ncbi:hypothetical protein BN1708_011985 [Verticillium longisporum]|uniref:Uncharacterized protein n=1 Tax=Verticillium longisporum TaxID=100787 RepID=A0A0G4L5H8_VERLO|nr:hypothetical protein BN1708_011985 [Verticillium longisporum]